MSRPKKQAPAAKKRAKKKAQVTLPKTFRKAPLKKAPFHTQVELFLRTLKEAYTHDESLPGLVLARLYHGFYASVVRYDQKWGQGKLTVCSTTEPTIEKALETLIAKWLAGSGEYLDSLKQLRAAKI